MKSSSWRELRLRLREQEGREFEREVERLLRFRFPDLVQSPARQRLDREGIDLVARNEQGGIDAAVQCKGYQVLLPIADQIRQARESILSFAESNEIARTYIFVHNRDGRARELRETVQGLLQQLVASGKCQEAEFYDLDSFLNHCKARLRHHIADALKTAAKRKLRELREVFEVGGPAQQIVPAKETMLVLSSDTMLANLSGRLIEVSPVSARNVQELLISRSGARFTLLTGVFGTGKSTAGLLAATSSAQNIPTIIFAECAFFSVDRLGSGLSVLLEEVLRSSGVFADVDGPDPELLRLAAPLLREDLGNRGKKLGDERQYVFILDGLDENRLYSRADGMAVLMNCLGDLHCPIVLTTRREHFIATFESLEAGLMILSKKHGWKRPIRVFSLEPWERAQTRDFALGSAETLRSSGKIEEADRVEAYVKVLDNGTDAPFYGSLSSHPLFLRLILDDVAIHGVRQIGRAQLLLEWSRYKIRRDMARKAQLLSQDWQFDAEFLSRVMALMENVAWAMTADAGRSLAEYLTRETFEKIARASFPEHADAAITALLNSLLVPRNMYSDKGYSVHFVYRIFQEFFLACYAVRHGLALAPPETQVGAFISDLREINFASSVAEPVRVF